MKHLKSIIKKAAAILIAAAILTGTYSAADQSAAKSVLNVAQISFDQLKLCLGDMLDGFESDGTVRAPLFENALYTDGDEGTFPSFEGTAHLTVSGAGKIGAELSFLKHPSLSGRKSVGIAVFIKPGDSESAVTLTLTATGTDSAVTASGVIAEGAWQTVYLPFLSDPGQLVSVRVEMIREDGGDIEAALDCLHSSLVSGMPENLQLFASSFSSYKGSVSYSGESLVFSVNGKDGYIESSVCNYIITEEYNTLAITIDNAAGASSAVLSCKMNSEKEYSESASFERELGGGKRLYYFKIGYYRGKNVLNGFKLTFPGKLKGDITVERIELTSYRYPASYPGTLTVSAAENVLTVSGEVPSYPATSTEIRLYRLLPSQDEERFEELDVTPYKTASPSKSFTFTVPRYDGDTDNALYKYFAVFSGKSNYYAAPAAYAPAGSAASRKTGVRCVSLPADLSLLPYAAPDTVFFTFDTEKMYCEDGTYNEEYLAPFDEAAGLMKKEGVCAAALIKFQSGEPDTATEQGLKRYVSLLEFIAERYAGVLVSTAVGPVLNGTEAAEAAGSEDRAVKYAAALARTAAYVLNPRGINVLLTIGADSVRCFDPIRFLQMLGEETDISGIKYGFLLDTESADTPYLSAESKKISSYLSSALLYGKAKRELIFESAFPSDETKMIETFYSMTEICSGVYFRGGFEADGLTELFRALDSEDGAAFADKAAAEAGTIAASLAYPHISLYKKVCRKIQITDEAPAGSVTVMFDGQPGEEWYAYDSCRGIYHGAVNNDPAAELAFDFSRGARGRAVFEAEPAIDNGAVYIRIYADYLPAEAKTVETTVTVYGDNGCVYGTYTLNESETAAIRLESGGKLGRINRIAFCVEQNGEETLSTPRICILGIYAENAASEETVTEAEETEAPKPETQIFVTETETDTQTEAVTEEKEDGTGRLLIITLCVMAFMFLMCGTVIFILKKISEKKKDPKI